MFTQDFILNGQATGPVAQMLAGCRFDPDMLRPYFTQSGEKAVTVNTGRSQYNKQTGTYEPVLEEVAVKDLRNQGIDVPVWNATSLRKEEWAYFDQALVKATRLRLRAWSDLMARNPISGFNGMSKSVYEYETASDPGEAVVDMDGLTPGRGDAPRFQLEGIPLPITHSDFFLGQRQLMISRSGNMPLDTTMLEACGRRVAETVEKTLIGVQTGLTYGAGTQIGGYGRTAAVYGYTNFPSRQTYTSVTTPTGSNPQSTVDNVLAMRELAYDAGFYGPFMLYHSTDWDQYLDGDYLFTNGSGYAAAPNKTLRNRLREIEGIEDVRRLDFMTPALLGSSYNLLLVQMTKEVAAAIDGMGISTVQWESQGGMRINFKVMAIWVPLIRADKSGNCGVVHGTTS